MSKLAPSNVTLIRGLTLVAAASIVIGNVVGTGVFLKARVMTCNVGTPGMVITVWIAAGILSLAGALTYAELAAMMPRAGGEYVFVREAYGARWGFLYGWMQIFIAKTGSQASVAVAFAIFLNDITGGALSTPFFTLNLFGKQFDFGYLQLVALALIAVITLINCATVMVSGWVATILTGVKITLVLGIGLGAFILASGNWGHFGMANVGGICQDVDPGKMLGMAGFSAAMLAALWGYDGWNNLTLVAGEVKNPQRNIPLALIGGTILIILLYVFVNIAYFYVMSPTEIASVSKGSSVAAEVARSFLGPVAIGLIAAALMASSVGTLHTSILTGARVPYAMSRDRLFFPRLARLSPRTHVPIGALVVQGIWAGILTLSGSFDTLTDYVIFGSWIFYGLVTASVFVFRRRMPNAERPYRAWGYPVVPILFLIVTGWLLFTTLLPDPEKAVTELGMLLRLKYPAEGLKGINPNAFIGLGLIALGLPVYWYLSRRQRVAFVGDEPADEEDQTHQP
ncbi:MAG: basic amino acid/polyamine antiporter, family [Acidobacteriota bacterium]|jgi:APA family basic amino acid/polyamine antiporter|nr:basic amino acid/polyamine antiporter, family [Acidobacteriota bacterium]